MPEHGPLTSRVPSYVHHDAGLKFVLKFDDLTCKGLTPSWDTQA